MGKLFHLEVTLTDGSQRRLRVADYNISTAVEFLDALQPGGGLFDEHEVFRGQGDSRWCLTPSAFRLKAPYLRAPDGSELNPTSYKIQVALEASLLVQFVEAADRMGFQVPGGALETRTLASAYTDPGAELQWETWPPNDALRALALAQHSGVPTRLLDWTSNPFIAAYFASHDALCKCNSEAFSVYVAGDFATSQPVPGARIQFLRFPQHENENLRAQQGLMMVMHFGGDAGGPFTPAPVDVLLSLAADNFQSVGSALFNRVTLPTSEAPTVLRLLHKLGIDGATAFPNYIGLARYAHEKAFWAGDSDQAYIAALTSLNARKMALYEQMDLPWRRPIFHVGNAQAVNGVCTIVPQEG